MGQPSKIVGRYELLESLGRGGMGHVYRARLRGARGFEKDFAVKRVLTSSESDPESVALFEREAKLSSRLNHPNLCQVLDFFQVAGDFYLVMEFIPGRNLADILSQCGTLSVPLTLYLVSEIAQGLDHAWRTLQLVHRDVTPHNILLSDDGQVKLIDFGIAKRADSRAPETEGIRGKVAYLSPEQVKGLPLDCRSDVYSLTLVLAECLLGRPVHGDTAIAETLRNIEEENIPDFKDIPEILKPVLRRGLALDPKDRFPTAGELGGELRAKLEATSAGYSSESAGRELLAIGSSRPAKGSSERGLETGLRALQQLATEDLLGERQKNRWPWLAFAGVGSLVTGYFLIAQQSETRAPAPPVAAVAREPVSLPSPTPPPVRIPDENELAAWVDNFRSRKVDGRTIARQLVTEGIALLKKKGEGPALEAFRKARLLDPTYLSAWLYEVETLGKLNAIEEARRVSRLLTTLQPSLRTLPSLQPYLR